jgi:hypothetical protein
MNREPAVSIGGSITAILYAAYAILKASGVEVTEDMTDGITALVLALCAVPAIGGLVTRFFVFSPATTEELVDEAYAATPGVDAAPQVKL